ncbi:MULTISPECIES: hypothetical protein [Bradyrhizobium]|uniref:hypothetical protein n=1 Tax=Bradyrhizobium TaxID=374 RepID=UPI001177D2ED|nr:MULTISPECIES: hypothetical protein [Bradyrhizobium]
MDTADTHPRTQWVEVAFVPDPRNCRDKTAILGAGSLERARQSLANVGKNRNIFPRSSFSPLTISWLTAKGCRTSFSGGGDPRDKPVCTYQRQTFQERAAAPPQPFLLGRGEGGKRFPDAAKHFMVAQSLWLLTSNFVKSKA